MAEAARDLDADEMAAADRLVHLDRLVAVGHAENEGLAVLVREPLEDRPRRREQVRLDALRDAQVGDTRDIAAVVTAHEAAAVQGRERAVNDGAVHLEAPRELGGRDRPELGDGFEHGQHLVGGLGDLRHGAADYGMRSARHRA